MTSGWEVRRLDELLEVQSGFAFKSKDYTDSGHFLIRIGNVQDGYLNLDKPKYVALDEKTDRFELRAGDILTSLTGNIGRVARVQDSHLPAALNQRVARLTVKPKAEVDEGYLFHFLSSESFSGALSEIGHGVAQRNVSPKAIGSIPLPLPSLPEQKLIVAILDEVFAGIDQAIVNTEKNIENARELFNSHLNTVLTKNYDRWDAETLISLCDLFVDSAHRTPKYQDEGIPALRPRDVVGGVLNLEGVKRVSEAEYRTQSKRHKPNPGDIVYSRELSYGWAARLPDSPPICLSQGMCLFRPSARLNPEYLLYVLNGSFGRNQAVKAAVGTAHPHINLGEIKSYQIPLPPLDEQAQIAERMRTLARSSQRLAEMYQDKLIGLAELKISAMGKAFSGQITASTRDQIEAIA